MRLLTATDITDFYNNGSDDLLALGGDVDVDCEFITLDIADIAAEDASYGQIDTRKPVTTDNGEEITVLITRTMISDGDWFPDALTEAGDLDPAVAGEMASIINNDAGLHTMVAVAEAREATAAWQGAADEADRRALARAHAVLKVVTLYGGNQSAAARHLGMDQSTVNKLVKKTARA